MRRHLPWTSVLSAARPRAHAATADREPPSETLELSLDRRTKVKLVPHELRVRRGTEEWIGHVARPATLIIGPQTPSCTRLSLKRAFRKLRSISRGSHSENATDRSDEKAGLPAGCDTLPIDRRAPSAR